MKRIIAFSILLFYGVSISGATFHLHFCASSLESVSFAIDEHEGCCCEKEGKKMESNNCCKDEVVLFQSKGGQKHSDVISTGGCFSSLIPAIFAEPVFNLEYSQFALVLPDYHSPPIRPGSCDLIVLHGVFRI